MLRAIEICGFKSFADRTRLEFGEGLSAVIGPNGSGKSNIVDAIKWVLGEQSMKKLRSIDSTDVIFGGSAERPPLGSAEVTLTFDNSKNIFDLETPEVHITRRIYRSGEGEYLINRQATRLKDIKDLLSGTGLGTQAYSIIEQGRVESLLQSSPVQRRVIFEDAADISKYAARKQEAQRRVERIDQNMIRIADIVSEKEQQLKLARSQAGKAQLYRQYSQRLQELRIHAGLADYRRHAAHRAELQTEVDVLTKTGDEISAVVEKNEKTLTQFNTEIETLDQKIRHFEGDIAATRQRIAGDESTIELQTTQAEELNTEIAQNGRQLLELNIRSVDIEEMMRKTTDDLRKAQTSASDISEAYQKLLEQGKEFSLRSKAKREERDTLRKEIESKHRQNNKLAGSISGLESRLATLETTKEQNAVKLEKLGSQNSELALQCDELRDDVATLEETVKQKLTQLDDAKQRKSSRVKQLAELTQKLSEQKQKQSGMKERISLLDELIQKNEGLPPAVRDVLQQARDPKSPYRHVFGLVANLFQADVDVAWLIDLALGANSQYVVVSPKAELFRHIKRNADSLLGRVGFIWLDPQEKDPPWTFSGRPGVLGRADQFVRSDPKFSLLARRLLGRTWIVENHDVAVKLYRESDDRTCFLTAAGELLKPDGALVVGPKDNQGLITRRSEHRTFCEQRTVLEAEIAETEIEVAAAQEHAANDEIDVEDETRQHQKAVTEYDTQRLKLSTAEERHRQGLEHYQHLDSEIEKLNVQIARTAEELGQSKTIREELDETLVEMEIRQTEVIQQLQDAEEHYDEHYKKTANANVELATRQERLENLKEQIRQLEDRLKERQTLLEEYQQRSFTLKERRESVMLAILKLESALAMLYLKKESLSAQISAMSVHRRELATQRGKLQTEGKRLQLELQKTRQKIHAKQLDLERCIQEQKTLVARLQEDYEIDLETFVETAPVLGMEAKQEIGELRSKIQKLGNVNLEAMETLDELETRYFSYSTRYNDLAGAKKQVEKIIDEINVKSQQLFAETFEGVRVHFRDIFQQLFGGGSADLVLENPTNILESGVEIVAKPPGKELKSVMLMSGGEKTLTCVALLLAFFRYKPNPVCILDECDAALDEGNVDRFVNVIKEFSAETQFLMITHNKKSMAAAKTMYGVTMQDAGVSTSVSVRFESINEEGEMLHAA
jgi:chromosome segregation protein